MPIYWSVSRLTKWSGAAHPLLPGTQAAKRKVPMATDVDHVSTVDRRTTATVRDVTYDLLRAYGLTTIFGNLGSTEEPFLADFPSDFRYVLGLQEASVIAMADGFAQATRAPALVNLHTAAGLGNAMGNLFTAFQNEDAADRHGRPADARDAPARAVAHEPRADDAAAAVGQVGVRTRAGAGRAGRVHARDRDRSPASRRTGVPVAAARRLEQAVRGTGRRADRRHQGRARPRAPGRVR